MIIEDFEQGSPEWFAARVGIPSASIFDKLITSKGVLSTSRQITELPRSAKPAPVTKPT